MSKDSEANANRGISHPVTLNCDDSPSCIRPLFAEMVKTLIEKNLSKKGTEKKDESEATESRDVTDLPDPSRKTEPAKGRNRGPGPIRRRNTQVRYTPYRKSSSTRTCCGNRSAMNVAKTASAYPVHKVSAMHVGDTLQQNYLKELQQQQRK